MVDIIFSIAHMEKLKLNEVCPSLYLVSVSAGFELESPCRTPPEQNWASPCPPSALCSNFLLQPLKTPVCQSNHHCKYLFISKPPALVLHRE